jgi:hydroxyacylglutathione hydrolase
MKITETVHAFKHPFRLLVGEGRYVDRFVYSYILLGKNVCLIDAGVWATAPLLQNYLKQIGRSLEEVSMVPLTHAHPDHIGGCLAIKKASNAPFCAHRGERPWIEDIEKQCRERPIPNFFELIEGPVPIGRELKEGDALSWDRGKTIRPFGGFTLLLFRRGGGPRHGRCDPGSRESPHLRRSASLRPIDSEIE